MRISDWSSDVCSSDLLVVVAEHDGPLDGARGDHHLARADGPVPLARLALGRDGDVIGHALDSAEGIVVVVAVDRGARQQGDIRHRRQHRPPGPAPGPAGQDWTRVAWGKKVAVRV